MSNKILCGRKVGKMARYSEEIIEEVRSQSDIVDVIAQYVTLKKKR